jgi:hypothetical protein
VEEPELEPVVEPVLEPFVPVVEPGVVVEPAVPFALLSGVVVVAPEAPIVVPLPVEADPLAVVSVLGVLGVVLAVLLVVSLGVVVVEGVVLDVFEVSEVSCLLQALRDRAAIRARAAHCAIGDLIIRISLRVWFEVLERGDSGSRCLRLTLVAGLFCRVVCHCRWL